ncbi:50S ribosomal protein L9 [Methylacidimicrobium cyclopophantes]|uniref:Large ribosomal subunit protein bL9 n=1 Tax=Methylacidimicrobium cyclopophantes TaxID=1041766 RepID=A0A5E6M5G3_9BACT|nr:50S ribosomal protein L9 [Methylacidimicrobium cyclopophantes]VVM04558.1 50S ribosomal protein L9 [Methylacidimicrobium cyclopophantes]
MLVEVLLHTRIDGLGAEGDLVKVKSGYAHNFLLPKRMATIATMATKHHIELLRKRRAEREAAEFQAAQELASRLQKLKLVFTLASGSEEQEKVFGAVTAQNIADRLKDEGIELDRKKIRMDRPLKELRAYSLSIDLHPDVTAQLSVELVPPAEKAKGKEAKAKGETRKKSSPRKAKSSAASDREDHSADASE